MPVSRDALEPEGAQAEDPRRGVGVGRGGVEKGKRHQPAGVAHRGARGPVRGGGHCYTAVSSESHGLITWGLSGGTQAISNHQNPA